MYPLLEVMGLKDSPKPGHVRRFAIPPRNAAGVAAMESAAVRAVAMRAVDKTGPTLSRINSADPAKKQSKAGQRATFSAAGHFVRVS